MDQVQLYAPRFPTLFLRQIPHARYIECNRTRAREFHTKYGQDTSADALMFRKAARNLISRAKQTLDELDLRFWMSSGTCLGRRRLYYNSKHENVRKILFPILH